MNGYILLAFHKWMIKSGWKLHSSGEYWFRGDEWPPKQEDMATDEELLKQFLL